MASILCLFSNYLRKFYCVNLGDLTDVAEIEYPHGWPAVNLLGSCYRRLCILNWDSRQVAICNPSTGRYQPLPPVDPEIAHGRGLSDEIPHIVDRSSRVYGFGYDDRNGEYVLRLVQTFTRPIVSAVSIYRSTTNVWRRLQQQMQYYLDDANTKGVFLHGRLHWIMRRHERLDSAKVLVAFDIRTEGFVEVNLPNVIDNSLLMMLHVLGGRLCLITYNFARPEVWIMREYGLNGPWDISFFIHHYVVGPVQPLAYSQNGRQLLMGMLTRGLVWYDLQTHIIEEFHINGVPDFGEVTCLEI